MIPRYTPLRKGKRTRENEAARRDIFPQLLQRSGRKCENCGRGNRPLQWSHVFGRPGSRQALGEWANTVWLTMLLCSADPRDGSLGCHEKFDRHLDRELEEELGWRAVHRLAAAFQRDAVLMVRIAEMEAKEIDRQGQILDDEDMVPVRAVDGVRELIRILEADGLSPAA